jgi:hypothetical protein
MTKVENFIADAYFSGICKNITACWNIYERECSFNEQCYLRFQAAIELAYMFHCCPLGWEEKEKIHNKILPARKSQIKLLCKFWESTQACSWYLLTNKEKLQKVESCWMSVRRAAIESLQDEIPLCQANEKLLEAEKMIGEIS